VSALTTALIAIVVILAAAVAIHAYAQWTIRNIDQQTALRERGDPTDVEDHLIRHAAPGATSPTAYSPDVSPARCAEYAVIAPASP
jgi:hypothetical protein